MEIIVLVWVLFVATLWLVRFLAEEAWAAVRGQTSPRIERRRAREKLAAECGTPTIGQALAFRVAGRIANPPKRRWAADARAWLYERWSDALAESQVRHQYAHETRMRANQRPPRGRHRTQQGEGLRFRTGGPGDQRSGKSTLLDAWEPCTRCAQAFVAPPETVCATCTTVTWHAPPYPEGPWVEASHRDDTDRWPACACGLVMLAGPNLNVSYDEGDATATVAARCPTCNVSTFYGWQLSDAEFEAEFGYPFGQAPDDDDEDDADAPDDEPDPQLAAVDPDREQHHTTQGEAHTMPAPTHTISLDVRDPRTALAFATDCRRFNDAVTGQMEILHNNLRGQNLGPGPLHQITLLGDATRTYSLSNLRSVTTYAAHVVTQQDIHTDPDLRETVRRTYLDTHGSDAAAPAAGKTSTRSVSAVDVRHPAAAARFMEQVAGAYGDLRTAVDQTKGNHQRQGVSGVPIAFLEEQLEYATIVAARALTAARTFRAHVAKVQDTVGSDPSLHGTQRGTYADPTKV